MNEAVKTRFCGSCILVEEETDIGLQRKVKMSERGPEEDDSEVRRKEVLRGWRGVVLFYMA